MANSQTNCHKIKIFSVSIPKGIRIKQINQQIKNGNAFIASFSGATSHSLVHYLDVNLNKYTDKVVIQSINHKPNLVVLSKFLVFFPNVFAGIKICNFMCFGTILED